MPKKKAPKKKDDSSRPEVNIADVVEELNNQLRKVGARVRGRHLSGEISELLPTGVIPLDAILGGGLPVGRITEVYGEEASGKSSLAMQAAATVTTNGGFVFVIDAERAWEEDRVRALGVDPDRMISVEAIDLEAAFISIFKILENMQAPELRDFPVLIIWDTIAATPKSSELPSNSGDDLKKAKFADGMASRARDIRAGMRKLTDIIYDKRATVMLLNHQISNFDVFGDSHTTPGGTGVRYASSLRLRLTQRGNVKFLSEIYGENERDKTVARYVEIFIQKSRVCKPFQTINIVFEFEKGFSNEWALFDLLYGKHADGYPLESSGAYYYHNYNPGPNTDKAFRSTGFYKKDFLKLLAESPGLFDYLVDKCYEMFAPRWWHNGMKALRDHEGKDGNCIDMSCIDCPEMEKCEKLKAFKKKINMD